MDAAPTETLPGDADRPAEPAAPREPRSLKKRLLFYAKLIVTIGLLVFIFSKVDWPNFWQQLLAFDLWVIAAVLVIWAVALSVSVIKWQQLLLVHGLRYPLGLLHRWYLISYFLSQFLPSIVGGDAFRIYKTLQNGKHRACAVLPVFVERASGLSALLALGAVCAALDWSRHGHTVSGWYAVCAAIGGAVGLAGLAVAWWLRLDRKLIGWRRTPSPIRSLLQHAADYLTHPRECFIAAVISFAFHSMRVMVYWLFLFGLDHPLAFSQVAVVAALTTVIGMLPISLGGYGLVDGSFVGLFYLYGVPPELGLTVALMTRVTSLPVAILGGYFYSVEKSDPRQPDRVDVPGGEQPTPA